MGARAGVDGGPCEREHQRGGRVRGPKPQRRLPGALQLRETCPDPAISFNPDL